MTTFSEFLGSDLDASARSDRELSVAVCIKAEFLSATVRLWAGLGAMITPDDARWQGWYAQGDDGSLQSLIEVPPIDDIRQGTSAPVVIRLGYLDEASFYRLRDDEEETDGRPLSVGYVYFRRGSTRALCQPGNVSRLTMMGLPSFSQKRAKQADGSHKLLYSVSVKAVGLNTGRSRIGSNVFTYTGHKFRSSILYGIEDDEYAQFIARYAGGVTLEL